MSERDPDANTATGDEAAPDSADAVPTSEPMDPSPPDAQAEAPPDSAPSEADTEAVNSDHRPGLSELMPVPPPPKPPPREASPTRDNLEHAAVESSASSDRARRDTLRGVEVPRGLRGRVRRIVRDVEERAKVTERRRAQIPAYALRITIQVLRQWARDRCPQQAASLAFQTVLSIVPLLAVTLAVLRATGAMNAESMFVEYLSSEFIPISRVEIEHKLYEWSSNVTFETLGLIGLITTVLLAFIMINSLERVVNYIWRSERKRSVAQKFIVFYATATIGPFLIGTSLYQAAKYGLTSGPLGILLSFATAYGALFLANFVLPACPVRWSSAAIGALVSSILFEAAKYLFGAYVTGFAFAKYSGMYGALAVAPLWLLWIYYCWLTLLLGVEVAHAAQNLHLLERADRRGTLSLENELLNRVNGVVAARVMVAIAQSYATGQKVVSRRALETRFDLSSEVLGRITQRLKSRDLIIEVQGDHHGFIPARPPHEISLAQVLRAFRGDDVTAKESSTSPERLSEVLRQLDADTQQKTGAIFLDQLY